MPCHYPRMSDLEREQMQRDREWVAAMSTRPHRDDETPPSYRQATDPPSYSQVREKDLKDWHDRQLEKKQEDMKKKCHRIHGESQEEFGQRKHGWQLEIYRRWLELSRKDMDRDGELEKQGTEDNGRERNEQREHSGARYLGDEVGRLALRRVSGGHHVSR